MTVNDDVRGPALTAAIQEYKLVDVIVETVRDDDTACFRCGGGHAYDDSKSNDDEEDEEDDDYASFFEPDPVEALALGVAARAEQSELLSWRAVLPACGSCVDKLGHGEGLRQYVVAAWRRQGLIVRTLDMRIEEDEEEEDEA